VQNVLLLPGLPAAARGKQVATLDCWSSAPHSGGTGSRGFSRSGSYRAV